MVGPDDATAPAGATDGVDAIDSFGAERYELIERLGEGAMGMVWSARDRVLDRTVALKVLHDQYLGAGHQERLTAEARAMARLSHPNVVALYDVGERDGRMYLTMELVRGETIKDWMATPRPWREVVAVFRDAARGLAAAHGAGVIHRDVKPTNILRGEDGVVRVADFGVAHAGTPRPALAAAATDGSSATATAGVIGTPAYMSPERFRGEPADARGDQFGLCVALYEALAGRRPFVAASTDELDAAVVRGAPPPPGAPRWLARVLARGLAADPAARFASMNDLVAALGGPRRRGLGIAAGALVVAGGAAALLLTRGASAPACDVGHDLDGVWDPAARQRGAAAFGGLGLEWAPATWTHLERGLDNYAAEWLAARGRVCRAGGAEQARRTTCLDDRKAALGGLVTSLAAPDRALAERASRLVVGLPRVADCERPTYLAGAAAGSDHDRDATRKIHEDVAAARIAKLTGRDSDVVPLADRAATAARAAGDRWLEADALMVRGDAELNSNQLVQALDTLNASIEIAGAIGAFDLQFDARLRLSQALDKMGRFIQAHRVLDLAEASLATMPAVPARPGYVLVMRARIFQGEGKYEEARAALERAVGILSGADGVDTGSMAVARNNLATTLHLLGRNEEALAQFQQVRELRASLGENHPMTGKTRGDMAQVLHDLGRSEEAFQEYERGIEILRLTPGKEVDLAELENNYGAALVYLGRGAEGTVHTRAAVELSERVAAGSLTTMLMKGNLAGQLHTIGRSEEAVKLLRETLAALPGMAGAREDHIAAFRNNLGVILGDLGRLDEATAELKAVLAVYERFHGARHPKVAQVLIGLARLEVVRERYRPMLGLAERALAIRDEVLPADHPDRGEALTFVAVGRLHLGDAAGAIAPAEQAIANLEKSGTPSNDAQWMLARALWQTGRDRPRALTLAQSVRDALFADETTRAPNAELIAEIDAWLAKRGGAAQSR